MTTTILLIATVQKSNIKNTVQMQQWNFIKEKGWKKSNGIAVFHPIVFKQRWTTFWTHGHPLSWHLVQIILNVLSHQRCLYLTLSFYSSTSVTTHHCSHSSAKCIHFFPSSIYVPLCTSYTNWSLTWGRHCPQITKPCCLATEDQPFLSSYISLFLLPLFYYIS